MGLRTRRRNLRGNDQTQGIGIRLLYRGELLEPTTPKATRKKAEMPRNGRKEPSTRRRPRRRPRSGASPRRKKRERTTKRTAPDTRGSATTARSSWTACRTRRRTASSGSARRTWTTTRRRSLTRFPRQVIFFFVRTLGTSLCPPPGSGFQGGFNGRDERARSEGVSKKGLMAESDERGGFRLVLGRVS